MRITKSFSEVDLITKRVQCGHKVLPFSRYNRAEQIVWQRQAAIATSSFYALDAMMAKVDDWLDARMGVHGGGRPVVASPGNGVNWKRVQHAGEGLNDVTDAVETSVGTTRCTRQC
jgi:hypothetical protein